MNNLAWLYHANGNPKALTIAQKAHEIFPDSGAITDTLGWLYVENGQAQEGLTLLRRAVQQAPNKLDIRYHLAVALAKTGDAAAAKELLREILATGKEFTASAEAEALLEKL